MNCPLRKPITILIECHFNPLHIFSSGGVGVVECDAVGSAKKRHVDCRPDLGIVVCVRWSRKKEVPRLRDLGVSNLPHLALDPKLKLARLSQPQTPFLKVNSLRPRET